MNINVKDLVEISAPAMTSWNHEHIVASVPGKTAIVVDKQFRGEFLMYRLRPIDGYYGPDLVAARCMFKVLEEAR